MMQRTARHTPPLSRGDAPTHATTALVALIAGLLALIAGLLALAGCDAVGDRGAAEPTTDGSTVRVGFATAPASAAKAFSGAAKADDDTLELAGTNGVLAITDIRLIVSKFELTGEGAGGESAGGNGDGDEDSGEEEGAEFKVGPSFVDLPLDTTQVAPVAEDALSTGRYTKLEFKAKDVHFEDESEGDTGKSGDNDEERRQLEDLLETIRTEFPDWPAEASMVVVGTFTPDGGAPQPFTTYFDAEIEVELQLTPPLEVTADGPSWSLTVRVDPAQWFVAPDGTAWNLAASDFASTETLIEFKAEFKEGVTEIKIDSDEIGDKD